MKQYILSLDQGTSSSRAIVMRKEKSARLPRKNFVNNFLIPDG